LLPSISTTERAEIYFYVDALDTFVGWVNQFLKSFRVRKIKSFLMNIGIDHKYQRLIDHWICWAIGRNVEKIGIFLIGRPYNRDYCPAFSYKCDLQLFSRSLKHLSLQNAKSIVQLHSTQDLRLIYCWFRSSVPRYGYVISWLLIAMYILTIQWVCRFKGCGLL